MTTTNCHAPSQIQDRMTYQRFAPAGGKLRNALLRRLPGGEAALLHQHLYPVVHAPNLQRLLLRYAHGRMVEAMQLSASHNLEQRLARWILTAGERLYPAPIDITHARLAALLGVRRAGITVALHMLEGAQAIRSTAARSSCATAPGWKPAPAPATSCCATPIRPEACRRIAAAAAT